MKFITTDLKAAEQFDKEDSLKSYREKFVIEDKDLIYLDGNSLGRLSHSGMDSVLETAKNQWGDRLIRGWNEGWYGMSHRLGKKIAHIIGAEEDEVIVADSTSINLYKLAYSAMIFQKGRKKIISDELNFPSDLYVLQSLIHILNSGHELVLLKSENGLGVEEETFRNSIDENTALLNLSHVAFKSSYLFDMNRITEIAHEKGAMILWDLSHSAGVIPINVKMCNADLAVGCTYKYLNGGPGSPAFLYVRRDLQDQLESPIWGWFGDDSPFKFNLNYSPAKGINKFLVGTTPILSASAIECNLDIILDAGLERIREKSIKLTDYLIFLNDNLLETLGFSIASPRDCRSRGSHVSLKHPEAYRICQAMIKGMGGTKVIPDFREPDNIRLGVNPLYNSFLEINNAVNAIRNIYVNKKYLSFSTSKGEVT